MALQIPSEQIVNSKHFVQMNVLGLKISHLKNNAHIRTESPNYSISYNAYSLNSEFLKALDKRMCHSALLYYTEVCYAKIIGNCKQGNIAFVLLTMPTLKGRD